MLDICATWVYYLSSALKISRHLLLLFFVHNQIAFVNQFSANIEEDLFAIATKKVGLNEALLMQLLRFKNENAKSEGNQVIEKISVKYGGI